MYSTTLKTIWYLFEIIIKFPPLPCKKHLPNTASTILELKILQNLFPYSIKLATCDEQELKVTALNRAAKPAKLKFI